MKASGMPRASAPMLLVPVLAVLVGGCSPTPAERPAERRAERPQRALPPDPVTPVLPEEAPNMAAPVALPPAPRGTAEVLPALPEDLPASNTTPEPAPFPAEVTTFMVDRDGCDHFRGEEAYDEDRRAFLVDNVRQLCTGTDAQLADLRRRYADNPDVTAALAHYEDRIEGRATP